MSAPDRPTRWWLRPATALPVIAVVVVVAVLLAPQPRGSRLGDQRLTTYRAGSPGARLFHDLATRLGWETRRHLERSIPADSSSTIALLSPPVALTGADAHVLLEHVRGGGGLLYSMNFSGELEDSLRVGRGVGALAWVRSDLVGPVDSACVERTNGAVELWSDGEMALWPIRWRAPQPDGLTIFAETQLSTDTLPAAGARVNIAAAGFTLGSGRIVLIADPDLLRNDVLRICRWGADVAAVRMLEYLDGGERRRLIFDEFRQGFGDQPGTLGTIMSFLRGTAPGAMLVQLVLAGLVLILALAPRLVPPRHSFHVERRSPVEHVEALGRAYDRVGATGESLLHLVAGLRRRLARHGAPPVDPATGAREFLEWLDRRAPLARESTATLRSMLSRQLRPADLVTAAESVREIERAFDHHPTTAARGPAPLSPTTIAP